MSTVAVPIDTLRRIAMVLANLVMVLGSPSVPVEKRQHFGYYQGEAAELLREVNAIVRLAERRAQP